MLVCLTPAPSMLVAYWCRLFVPVDLTASSRIALKTVKELSGCSKAVVPVRWNGTWAVLFLDDSDDRYVGVCCLIYSHCPALTNRSVHVFAPAGSSAFVEWKDLLGKFRFVVLLAPVGCAACLLACLLFVGLGGS